ncbi:efflux RND transporter periplasmic adaptor subunit [Lichenibacterium dinghuense]|uniref:efflux RND transporter periplasmic adaptor subunit n=1 Tax=Lichenibacterium dinghuense TaxID=2895977 RepID=UPI001F0131D8|nr:efflux RND transporter periplasmic adaptor subunit [Lichenibacterium sp. 6Y81]
MRRFGLALALLVAAAAPAAAQAPPGGPPAVGVLKVTKHPVTETNRFIGRIQATQRVDIVARVTAFLDSYDFKEGQEVKAGQLLYKLEQPPFQAAVQADQGAVEQFQAQLANANVTLQRANTLINTPAGLQSTVDSAKANQGNVQGQLLTAQAQLKTAQINLGYTTIASPIDGKIGQTNVTAGNVVSPSSGTLATVVGQDPMYVVFPVSVRSVLELRDRYVPLGGFDAVKIRILLPDGRTYGQTGKLNFVNNTVATSTDTITLRGTISNPIIPQKGVDTPVRELFDGEFVTVLLEGAQPVDLLAIPQAAVLTDQQGSYVYVVGDDNKAVRQNVQLGQTEPPQVAVLSGLKEGQTIVVDGLQRVRVGQPVNPGPPPPNATDAAQKAVQ